MESGIVTIGITTDRNEPRNSRITRITIAAASAMVLNTSSMEAEMKFEASYTTSAVMPLGRVGLMSSMAWPGMPLRMLERCGTVL